MSLSKPGAFEYAWRVYKILLASSPVQTKVNLQNDFDKLISTFKGNNISNYFLHWKYVRTEDL